MFLGHFHRHPFQLPGEHFQYNVLGGAGVMVELMRDGVKIRRRMRAMAVSVRGWNAKRTGSFPLVSPDMENNF